MKYFTERTSRRYGVVTRKGIAAALIKIIGNNRMGNHVRSTWHVGARFCEDWRDAARYVTEKSGVPELRWYSGDVHENIILSYFMWEYLRDWHLSWTMVSFTIEVNFRKLFAHHKTKYFQVRIFSSKKQYLPSNPNSRTRRSSGRKKLVNQVRPGGLGPRSN